MPIRQTPPALVFLLGAIGGCSPPRDAPGAVRADSAGVEVVVATPREAPLPWTFREVWRVGGDANDTLAFGSPRLGLDASRGVLVLDPFQHRVVVLDPGDGSVRAAFGREGGGPGEFRLPMAIVQTRDEIWVLDIAKGSLVRFDAAGSPLAERALGVPVQATLFSPTDGGAFVDASAPSDDDRVMRTVLQLHADLPPDTVFQVSGPLPGMIEVPGCGVRAPLGRLFEPVPLWTAWGETLVVGLNPDYHLDVLVDGRVQRSLRLDVPARPLTPQLARSHYAAHPFTIGLPSGRCTADADAMIEAQGLAERVPSFERIRLGPGGTLWVRRRSVGDEPPRVDVWTTDGRYLGPLPPGAPFPDAFVSERRFLVVERDALDVPTIVAYDVDRP